MIDIEVEDPVWTAALPDAEALVRAAAKAALASEGAGGEGVTLLLADDAAVRELNARFRGKDSATNVLSFPAPPNPERHLGDVALACGVCAREAAGASPATSGRPWRLAPSRIRPHERR